MTLEEKYPFIASWVVDGELHIGRAEDYGHQPYAGVYDAGGIVWEMDHTTFANLCPPERN